jgi:hypothetical protein
MDCDRATGTFAVNVNRDFLKLKTRHIAVAIILSGFGVFSASGQAVPYARTFSKSKTEVEQALKDLQAYTGQKLPIVDGFVGTTQQPLDRYERAFYQFSIEVLPGVPEGTIVQISAKITAWYADKDPTKSGYQILPSNGRLELDLLDRLDEKFGNKPAPGTARALASSGISAPTPKLNLGGGINMSPGSGNPIAAPEGTEELNRLRSEREAEEKRMHSLNVELQGLEEVKKNQAHPLNLVTVKRAGTPVMARAGEESRVLFKAAVNDEFEFLDAEGEWIHVQISGVSRGYIRRNALELPEVIAAHLEETAKLEAAAKRVAFRVEREENSVFPGDWEALKGKTVKIYTLQPVSQDAKETDARAKLKFAESLMQKFGESVTLGAAGIDGVVVIFDSADGGIAGATGASIQQLAKGEISEEAFWKQCYLDPPETFQSKR